MQLKWREYALLMRLDKPIGIYLLLWPTLLGLWFAADGVPDLWILFVFCAGVFLMRSAGCVINDFADRNFDGHVERTKERPLAAGRVSTKEALILFTVLCAVAFALVLTLNRFTILLSFVGVLLAASYPFAKRFTHLPQAHLGTAFAWAIPMSFAAIQNTLPSELWILFIITILWAVIYDTMYAMVDRDDDLQIGVKSTAILFGRHDKLIIAILQIAMLCLLLHFAIKMHTVYAFSAAILVVLLLFIHQQKLIAHREPDKCFQAFLNNHYVGAVLFLGVFVDKLI